MKPTEVVVELEVLVIKITKLYIMKLYFLFLLFLIYLCCHQRSIIEGNINETQFYTCSNEINSIENINSPPTNYKKIVTKINEPLNGSYTSFIDANDLRNYDKYHRTPICSESYFFEDNYDQQFMNILDNKDKINKNYVNILKKENEYYDLHIDPFIKERSLDNFKDKLIYEKEIIDDFLTQKSKDDRRINSQ